MVAISLYRGSLHRVPDAPRQWQMPPRAITLGQFRILTRKRKEALARFATAAAAEQNPCPSGTKDEEEAKLKEGGGAEVKNHSDAKPITVEEEPKGAEDSKKIDPDVDADANVKQEEEEKSSDPEAVKVSEITMTKVRSNLDTDTEARNRELEKKLEVLKQKKHHLVQMLKLILNAEEEIKRRNALSSVRSSTSVQAEIALDMGSATRHVPKLSVEVNFSGDIGAETDAAANHSAHGRQIHHVHSTSPAAASFTRPFQQNTFLSTPRPSLAASGQGQPTSNVLVGHTAAAATSSPYHFAPSGHQGHHHSSSLPLSSVPGSQFMASSPSPAASGGASSVFRDSRVTSSS